LEKGEMTPPLGLVTLLTGCPGESEDEKKSEGEEVAE
jgi:hypothetical protein